MNWQVHSGIADTDVKGEFLNDGFGWNAVNDVG